MATTANLPVVWPLVQGSNDSEQQMSFQLGVDFRGRHFARYLSALLHFAAKLSEATPDDLNVVFDAGQGDVVEFCHRV
jgi:hypothetical protein